MNPRKKSKPNPDVAPGSADGSGATPDTPAGSVTLHDAPSRQSLAASTAPSSGAATPTTPTTPIAPGKKWLGGAGSWRRKAPPTVTTAKESIGVGVSGGATAELPGEQPKKARDDSPARFLTKRKSSKSVVLPASMTKLHVSSDGLVDDTPTAKPAEPATDVADAPTPDIDEPPLPPEPLKTQATQTGDAWGWKSWWSRPDGYKEGTKARGEVQGTMDAAQSTLLPEPTPSEEPDASVKGLETSTTTASALENSTATARVLENSTATMVSETRPDGEMKDAPPGPAQNEEQDQDGDAVMKDAPAANGKAPTRPSSWFWSWSKAQNAQPNPPPPVEEAPTSQPDQVPEASPEVLPELPPRPAPKSAPEPVPEPAQDAQPPQQTDTPAPAETIAQDAQPTSKGSAKPSGWAFWYRGKPEDNQKPTDGAAQKHVGEVAVFDTPSQSHPEAAQFNEQEQPKDDAPQKDDVPQKDDAPQKGDAPQESLQQSKRDSITTRSLRSLRGRPKTKSVSKDPPADTPSSSNTVTPTSTSPVREPAPLETAPGTQPAPKQSTKTKQEPPNLLFPEFKTTYQLVQQPSFWKQVRQYFLGGEPATPHLHINPAPPRIKKAVAIGIHGYFPAPIFQKVIGQPKGTSIRFANSAATAIKDWTEARGYTPEIEQIALEGEGFIAERVNTLWKLLLNWIDHIKAADFILVACHSQGVPVAMMLVAKLIQFGCVSSSRIGICAMAGVNMGPFIEYRTKYFGATAAELFEFSNPKSVVSQMYLAALNEVLRYGVRIMYVGSIDDQLVSLESSTFSTLSHPYIYRAVFVDGRIHAPDFLTHLVGFTLKLRNLGLPDHGLIRELSPALAGSLYGGEGHSRVYEDAKVYQLAVQHALETTSLPVHTRDATSSSSTPAPSHRLRAPVVGADKSQSLSQTTQKDKADMYQLRVKDYESPAAGVNQNPFFLPWAMRGLLEEEFVKKALGKEVEELLGMFEEWTPSTKQLKDVKFRLEAVRSKL
ncbi:hypothetical protein P153DRAFT_433429 [Dothidotthia symphoricarpi CBS 119687]|uniref:YMC020W-like alpha/beta hydrolase domain-containing protein n=1 Tax=Dothidotthia symphoricarpi CBS 119687 TaxID=1392245 RepID=A0A6A6A730_9PLEO|nr:uncharacterized protein P153DRAFT_433429 [Dothidotthia symphoricarpi CBS 119687]KAF2126943.1 hypothetical protein P153DRAFT_433429 [Dothidotthia symphoricarpi CBS 119687]